MSRRSFTIPAHCLRKNGDLDLRPVRLHPFPRLCSPNLRTVAPIPPFAWLTTKPRCGELQGLVHPLPRVHAERENRQDRRLWRVLKADTGILLPIPSHGCLRRAPVLPDFPMSHSVTRSVLIPRPAARHGSASHYVRPAGFGFQKIFSANLRTERGRKDFPNLPKKRRLALGTGHIHHPSTQSSRARGPRYSRRFAQECPE